VVARPVWRRSDLVAPFLILGSTSSVDVFSSTSSVDVPTTEHAAPASAGIPMPAWASARA
jgi:hypothetical protein